MSPTLSHLRTKWSRPFSSDGSIKPSALESQIEGTDFLSKAIEEAVANSLNNGVFRTALAAQVAQEIQPYINAALENVTSNLCGAETKFFEDTQQLSQRLDESNTNTTSSLSYLSDSIETSNKSTVARIATVEDAVKELMEAVNEIRDNLHSAPQVPIALSPASAQVSPLDAIMTELDDIKYNADNPSSLNEISSELTSMKMNVDAGNKSLSKDIRTISTQLGQFTEAIEEQSRTIADIRMREGRASSEFLDAIERANELYAAEGSILSEVVSGNCALKENLTSIEDDLKTQSEMLAAIREDNTSAIEAIKRSDDSHVAEGTILAGIMAAQESRSSDLAEKIGEDTKEILKAVKKADDSSNHQTVVLSQIKEALAAQSMSLADIMESDSGAKILSHIRESNDYHDKHDRALEELTKAEKANSLTLSGLRNHIGGIATTLSAIISTESEIYTALRTSNASHTSTSTQFESILDTHDLLTARIGDISAQYSTIMNTLSDLSTMSSESFAAVKSSNDIYSENAACLKNIMTASNTTTPALQELETEIRTIISQIADIQTKDLGPEILATVNELSETHAKQATLEEIRDVGGKVQRREKKISHEVEELKRLVDELRSMTASAGASQISSSLDLSHLATSLDIQAADLAEIKDISSSANSDVQLIAIALNSQMERVADAQKRTSTADLEPLETAMRDVLVAFDNQTTALADIKDSISEAIDLRPLEASVRNVINNLDFQSHTLSEIKAKMQNPSSLSPEEVLGEIVNLRTHLEGLTRPPTPNGRESEKILHEVKAVKEVVKANVMVIGGLCQEVKKEVRALEVLERGNRAVEGREDEILLELKALKRLIEVNGLFGDDAEEDGDSGVAFVTRKPTNTFRAGSVELDELD